LKGYIGRGYLYAQADSGAQIRFEAKAPCTGRFDIRIAYQPHRNRGSRVPVSVRTGGKTHRIKVNMKRPPQLQDRFASLGHFDLKKGDAISIVLETTQSGGYVHADAVQIVRVDE
jgi:hypothetical protein